VPANRYLPGSITKPANTTKYRNHELTHKQTVYPVRCSRVPPERSLQRLRLSFALAQIAPMSDFSNPKIAAIDDGLAELDPCLAEFGRSRGFALTRSHEGLFNVPRRWLHREWAGIRHEIGLIIASPMPERLERGLYPDIPCALYVAAFNRAPQKHYQATVLEAQPFGLLKDSLSHHLADALARLDACTAEFISHHGVCDHKG
jgi:hypothetical protein